MYAASDSGLGVQGVGIQDPQVLKSLKLTEADSVLVVSDQGEEIRSWQAEKLLVPASLTKLATAHLAIQKWGLNHAFHTDFFVENNVLWIKGYGDPYLVSEEFDRLIPELEKALKCIGLTWQDLSAIKLDNSYFNIQSVPGRSSVSDPYNAPISAISANFNTANLRKDKGAITSAEGQTPLTPTAKRLAKTMLKRKERVNLRTSDNAQLNFAELLLAKLDGRTPKSRRSRIESFDYKKILIYPNERLPVDAELLYRHVNSLTLSDILRGTLEFSNNFMANHVFLKLADSDASTDVSFSSASKFAEQSLAGQFSWQRHALTEGSGLSRSNRLSARQIDDLLRVLEPNKALFKKIKVDMAGVEVYAKTGTLNGVRSYAGYIDLSPNDLAEKKSYRFVFNFNRAVPYRYRDTVLEQLIKDLVAQ